jgi:Ca2+-binding RTX toxin-like protein
MNDANVAGGQTLYVSANTLRAGVSGVTDETLLFNGAAETNGNFVIYSGAAQDVLTGGSGNDTFYGGGLSDTLTGGAGNDTFAYTSTSNSILGYSDVINDFTLGDLIGLSAIDANSTTVGDDAFNFIGTAAFTGSGAASAGELRFQNIIATTWQVQADTNGDGTADLVISVNVTDADPITAADFVL